MAKTSFDVALIRLLADEGGYTNHPSDPGGPTNFGITIADARQHWKANITSDDLRKMSLSIAKIIYRSKYWDAQRCDDLPAGVDYAVFDYGVNSGIGRSGKVLRRKLGLSDKTSVVNDEVIATALKANSAKLVRAICDERLAFLKSLKTWPVFGVGWGRRVVGVRAQALNLASNIPIFAPLPASVGATAKGVVPAPKAAQAVIISTATVVGTASGGIATTYVTAVVAVLLVLAVGIGAIVLVNYLRNRKQEAAVIEPTAA